MAHSSVGLTFNGVPRTLVWNGNTATFTPTSALTYDTAYTIAVTGKDLSGNSLTVQWSFTTMKHQGSVTGTIKDATGVPLAGATVTLENGMNVTTDSNGMFSIDNVTAGSHQVTVTKDGYQPMTQDLSTGTAGSIDLASTATPASSPTDYSWLILIVGALLVALLVMLLVVRRRKKRE